MSSSDITAQTAPSVPAKQTDKTNQSNQTKPKKRSVISVIFRREMSSFFSGPIAYIVCGLFLVFSGIFFFSTYFLANRADLRGFFGLLPILFSFFIPALTMRVFSEEQRTGSMETLMTLPVSAFDVAAGKYLSSLVSVLVMLVPTLFYVITAAVTGSPDYGPIVGGYLGAVFLAAAFTSVGVFASSLSKNQIVSFFIAGTLCILLAMIDVFLVIVPASIVGFFQFFSAQAHFSSIARGIIDSRDLLYFLSLTAVFFTLTVKNVEKRRAL